MPRVISIQQLKQLAQFSIRVIDIRDKKDFKPHRWFEAENIPYDKLMLDPEKYLKPGETVFLICVNGTVSYRAARILEAQGYEAISIRFGYIGSAGSSTIPCSKK